MTQMDEIDANVRRLQSEQDKSADQILQEKLAARRKKKNSNLDKQRELKSEQL